MFTYAKSVKKAKHNFKSSPSKTFKPKSFVDSIYFLQKTIGNQAVSSLIQKKLKIGNPDDRYEKEADQVAEKIMKMPNSTCPSCEEKESSPFIQTQEAEEKEEEVIQTKPLFEEITPVIQRQAEEEEENITGVKTAEEIERELYTLKGMGQPLSLSVRKFFEPRFGVDFSNVRIHADGESARMARALNAEAFTYGRDIYFAEGRYRPETTEGKKLLAHELTHVVQQKIGIIQRQNANTWTYGEIRSWAIISQNNFNPPNGLPNAKASIGSVCSRGSRCASVDGSNATNPADRAAWRNIVNATGGQDLTGNGNFMCVGTQNCWFVHSCYRCSNGQRVLVRRNNPLSPSGTAIVSGKGTLYFYYDPLRGWCNRNDYISGCRGAQG